MSKKNVLNQKASKRLGNHMNKTSLHCKDVHPKIKSENQLGNFSKMHKGPIFCSLKKINHPNNLSTNLEVINSQSYQDLVFKLRILKQQKQAVIAQIRKEKKERKHELKNLFKDKAKIKMEIWEKIGVVCRIREEIVVQKQRSDMLHQFLSHGVANIQIQNETSISDRNMQS